MAVEPGLPSGEEADTHVVPFHHHRRSGECTHRV
jgi:hypothetical protein